MNRLLAVSVLVLSLTALAASETFAFERSPVFGPETFVSETGSLQEFQISFPVCDPDTKYAVVVENGDSGGGHTASDGSVYINGGPVIYPADFANGFTRKERLVSTVVEANTGVVKVGGSAGARVTVTVKGYKRCIEPSIVSPADGATITGNETFVSGTVELMEGAELGVTVNGMLAEVNGTSFTIADLPLAPGDNYIAAVATDELGNVARQVIKITATGESEGGLSLTPDPVSGPAPLDVSFTMNSSVGNAVSFELDYGDGSSPATASTLDDLVLAAGTHTYTDDGLYEPTLSVTDGDSVVHEKVALVNVAPLPDLAGKWGGMKTALLSGNIETAGGYLSLSTRESFKAQFQNLKDAGLLYEVATSMGTVVIDKLLEGYAFANMDVVIDGKHFSVFVLYSRDEDGLWRIKAF